MYCLYMGLDWREKANCRGMTKLMYSDKHKKARRVCWLCPGQTECLMESFEEEDINYPMYGVRAGMSAAERFRYRRMMMQ